MQVRLTWSDDDRVKGRMMVGSWYALQEATCTRPFVPLGRAMMGRLLPSTFAPTVPYASREAIVRLQGLT